MEYRPTQRGASEERACGIGQSSTKKHKIMSRFFRRGCYTIRPSDVPPIYSRQFVVRQEVWHRESSLVRHGLTR
ncbi:MAG: hypothetical protein IKO60_07880 [Bacteroidaceae bacterium]|nr:hypothetical protein [Bacteroidaceae bacterium]